MEEMYLPKTSKKSFSTIPINPVGLASHLTTNETNQVEKNAKIKGKSKTNPFTKSHSQTNQLKESMDKRHYNLKVKQSHSQQ